MLLATTPTYVITASTCCHLLLTDLTLLVNKERTEDKSTTLAITTTALWLALGRNQLRRLRLYIALWPIAKEIRLGGVVCIQGAQEVEVGLGAQTVRLCQRRIVAELIGSLNVQQCVWSIRLLLKLLRLPSRQANDGQGHGQGVKLRKRTERERERDRVSQVGKDGDEV